jgi:hypothetical protein
MIGSTSSASCSQCRRWRPGFWKPDILPSMQFAPDNDGTYEDLFFDGDRLAARSATL